MVLLIFLSATGLVISVIVHFCGLFHIFNPLRELSVLISIGAIVVLYPAFVIRGNLRSNYNGEDFNKTLFNACPRWMQTILGLFIMYALAGLIFSVFRKYFGVTVPPNATGSLRGFTGYWMSLYALAFAILYGCMKLKK
jgi:hypothetical protein